MGKKPQNWGFLWLYTYKLDFFGFLELEVVFWDNINYIFNCINSDFKLKKEPRITVWIDGYKFPSPLFPPFSLFEERFSK